MKIKTLRQWLKQQVNFNFWLVVYNYLEIFISPYLEIVLVNLDWVTIQTLGYPFL